jgi:hypothetical protein
MLSNFCMIEPTAYFYILKEIGKPPLRQIELKYVNRLKNERKKDNRVPPRCLWKTISEV